MCIVNNDYVQKILYKIVTVLEPGIGSLSRGACLLRSMTVNGQLITIKEVQRTSL